MKRNIVASIGLGLLTAISVRADHDSENSPSPSRGAVYTMDNAASGNNVWAYGRRPDGTLTAPSLYPTQGLGSGNGLGNQGAVLLSSDGRWLIVCNAGSDEISVFGVTPRGLIHTDKVGSEGRRPISLTLHGNLLYVLNAGGAVGGADNLAGFVFAHGQLLHLPGAVHSLSAASTAPAEVAFTRDGDHLVVSEKATGIIDTFSVGADGLVDGHKMFQSPAPPPFGFAAGRHNRIFVTEANGGAGNPGASSVSSYQVTEEGDLEVISASVPSHQTAACWLALSRDERFAYTANTPNATISSYGVGHDGSLTLLQAQAASTGASGAVDLALTRDGNFLYSLQPGGGSIGVFSIQKGTGNISPVTTTVNLPITVNGLAAW